MSFTLYMMYIAVLRLTHSIYLTSHVRSYMDYLIPSDNIIVLY